MGLDIVAYQNIKLDPSATDSDWEKGIVVRFYVEDRPQSSGIKNNAYYRTTGSEYCFRAGSYGGYNQWRNSLAQFGLGLTDAQVWEAVRKGKLEGKPFVELINFSDCEGVIDGRACAKLAKDFAEHHKKAQTHFTNHDFQVYEDFMEAFQLAADEGCVRFC